MSVKGDWPRPLSTTREELDLRQRYANGKITLEEFNVEYKNLMKQGLIKRNGRILREG